MFTVGGVVDVSVTASLRSAVRPRMAAEPRMALTSYKLDIHGTEDFSIPCRNRLSHTLSED